MESKTTITTVTIDSSTAKKLDRLAKASGLSKKDFIAISMDYFLKNGIDPVTCETPTHEIAQLRKRVEDLFGFIHKIEIDAITPMDSSNIKNHAVTHSTLEEVKTQIISVVEPVVNTIRDKSSYIYNDITFKYKKELAEKDKTIERQKKLIEQYQKKDEFKELLDAFTKLKEYVDPKDKTKLSQVVSKLSNL